MSQRSHLRSERLARANFQCEWPECETAGSDNLEMAHLIQLSQGGPDEISNVAMLCRYHHSILDGRAIHKRREATMILLRSYLRAEDARYGIIG